MDIKQDLEDYIIDCAEAVQKTDFSVLSQIAEKILKAYTYPDISSSHSLPRNKNSKRIFTAGNGGSSATASHMVNDLVKGCRVSDRPGFDAMCLSDSSVVVTCLANDYCYDDIYKIMLETYADTEDILIVFSGSGNSPNIINACKYAKNIGMYVIGFGGRDGGKMKDLCDICLIAPTDSMEALEDMHLMYEHALITVIRNKLS